jgi:hypothetical protein
MAFPPGSDQHPLAARTVSTSIARSMIQALSAQTEGLAEILGDFFNSIDPTETWAAQDFRSAKALFVLLLKRVIVPSIACTRPPAGG